MDRRSIWLLQGLNVFQHSSSEPVNHVPEKKQLRSRCVTCWSCSANTKYKKKKRAGRSRMSVQEPKMLCNYINNMSWEIQQEKMQFLTRISQSRSKE